MTPLATQFQPLVRSIRQVFSLHCVTKTGILSNVETEQSACGAGFRVHGLAIRRAGGTQERSQRLGNGLTAGSQPR